MKAIFRNTAVCTCVLVLLGGCTSTTTTRVHPGLNEQLEWIETVVVVPPRIEIQYLTLTGENERMLEKEQEIAQLLRLSAENRLTGQGFTPVEFDFEAEIESDQEFAYLVTQVREGFDQAREDLKLGRRIPDEEAMSIRAVVGEAVNMIADKTGADAILLIRYSGFDKSDGYVAKDVGTSILVGVLTMGAVVPVQATSGAITEFALIDGVTGEVLWADTRIGSLDHMIGEQTLSTMPADKDIPELTPQEIEPPESSEGKGKEASVR